MECGHKRVEGGESTNQSVLVVAVGNFSERGYDRLLQQIVLMVVTGGDGREKAVRLIEMAIAVMITTVSTRRTRQRLHLNAHVRVTKAVVARVQRRSGRSSLRQHIRRLRIAAHRARPTRRRRPVDLQRAQHVRVLGSERTQVGQFHQKTREHRAILRSVHVDISLKSGSVDFLNVLDLFLLDETGAF